MNDDQGCISVTIIAIAVVLIAWAGFDSCSHVSDNEIKKLQLQLELYK